MTHQHTPRTRAEQPNPQSPASTSVVPLSVHVTSSDLPASIRTVTIADYLEACERVRLIREALGIAPTSTPLTRTLTQTLATAQETEHSKRLRLAAKHPALGHALHWLPDTVFDMACTTLVELLHVGLQASSIWLVAVEHWSIVLVPATLVLAVLARTKLSSALDL